MTIKLFNFPKWVTNEIAQHQTMNDQTTLDKVRKGDEDIIKELYREHREQFLKWVQFQYNLDSDSAADIFQWSIVIFYENIASGKLTTLTSSVKTYLYSIGKNKAMESIRMGKRMQKTEIKDDLLAFTMEEEEDDEEFKALVRVMYDALQKIGDPCKMLLEKFYFEGLKLDELLGIMKYANKDTLKTKKYKCIQRLKKLMLGKP